MKISLKLRIIILLTALTAIPIILYFYHHNAMRDTFLKDRLRFNKVYASSVVSRVELFLERVISEAESYVYLYRNLGFSEEEIIWRVTGQIKGIFEGAFYSPEGELMVAVSREKIEPNFQRHIRIESEKQRDVLGIKYTQYKEPFLRFYVKDSQEGLPLGFFVFSLDLSLFWQSVVSAKPYPGMEVFLTDREGNILAFSDMRFASERKIPLREGIYRSNVTGLDVIGVYVTSEDGKWKVVVEEPLLLILEPLQNFQQKAFMAGSAFLTASGLLAIFVFIRIFRPLESLRNYVISWEKENINKMVEEGDEVSQLSQAFENLIRKLDEEKRLYISLFENTLDGVLVFNSEGRVIDVNRTFLEQFRMKREELIGRSMEELIGERLPMTSLFFSERKVKLREEIYCQLRQEVIRSGENTYILWRLIDLSEERELKVLLEQTARLSLAGEIACSIAHQINNPLASIMGYAEVITLNSRDKEVRRNAEIILRHSKKCADIVKKLLDMGKPFEGEPSYIRPEDVTLEAINILSPKAKRKGVKIEFRSFLKGEKVFTFPWQLEQILINVIDNAVDASPPGSKVEVRLSRYNNFVKWEIADFGEGISEEDKEKVFKPFYTTKKYGTGLGLSVAKRFVESMGGSISIGNNFPRGTVIEILLRGDVDENFDS